MKKDRVLAILEELNKEQLKTIQHIEQSVSPYKQLNNSWSLVQIIEHIYLSQKGTFTFIKEKGLNKELGKISLVDTIKNFFLKYYLKGKKKFKAPRVLPEPANKTSPQELFTKFSTLNSEIESYFKALPEDKLNKVVFKHPRAGKMDILAVVKFWSQHWYHHRQQINERING